LRARALIPPTSYDTVIAEYSGRRERIERRGKAAAALTTAHRLALRQPEAALAWAQRARQIDPEQPEGWRLATDLLARLQRYDDALALGAAAAQRFSGLQHRLAELQREKEQYEAASGREAEQQRRAQAAAEQLAEAERIRRERVMRERQRAEAPA